MKRKKWTEEEEAALIREYAAMISSGSLAGLKTREKKFQPIADRVNSSHHLRDPVAFPFRWSWRDVSIKIQNMRHQYLGVKQKIRSPPSATSGQGSSFDWAAGDDLWPNFLLYKQVFGDGDGDGKAISDLEEEDEDNGEESGVPVSGLAELGESLLKREERRKREREDEREREEEEEVLERRWRLERRREEEEMEWRERVMGMQMEHEKRMMQMHLEACQAQVQIVGFLVRLMGQFLGPGGGGDGGGLGGLSSQGLHGLQHHHQQHHRQQDPPSMGGDNGKSDASSAGPFI